jgi:hypothetical protein
MLLKYLFLNNHAFGRGLTAGHVLVNTAVTMTALSPQAAGKTVFSNKCVGHVLLAIVLNCSCRKNAFIAEKALGGRRHTRGLKNCLVDNVFHSLKAL